MKKIVFVIDNLGSGGAQKQLQLLAIGLVKNLFEVAVYCYDDYGRDFYSENLIKQGVRIIKRRHDGYFKRIIRFRFFLLKEKPDTVVSFLYGANLLSTLTKLTLSLSYRLVVADRTGVVDPVTKKDRLRYQLYRTADLVLANSSHTAEKIKQRAPWLKNKTKVNWNMVTPVKGFTKSQNKKIKFLFAARYHPVKNHKNFLKAFIAALEQSPNREFIELHCFGSKLGASNEKHYNQLEQIISNSVYSDQIFLNDETESIHEEIKSSDFCVLPSFFEGCPNFAIEGMSAGKVILLSNVCSNPDILLVDGGLLFSPHSVEEMKETLKEAFIMNLERRNKMGDFNRARAQRMFDPNTNLMEFIELIGRPPN